MKHSLFVAAVAFTYLFGGAIVGFFLQSALPKHHLSKRSKTTFKLGAGLIATMAALILGLLVASSKGTLDAANNKVADGGARLILLDRTLDHYGPETAEARKQVRRTATALLMKIWPEEVAPGDRTSDMEPREGRELEGVEERVRALTPRTDAQRSLQEQALQICEDLESSRWMLIEESLSTLPVPLLAVTFFWLTTLNGIFGLFAPHNLTVLSVLFVCSISIAGAVFLMLEMNSPLHGLIKVSSAPIHKALEEMSQ